MYGLFSRSVLSHRGLSQHDDYGSPSTAILLRLAVTPGDISGSSLFNGLRIGRLCNLLSVILASSNIIISAQTATDTNFADLIREPASIQRTLEHCDGHPEFETALANWLERAEPSSPAGREAVHKASLRLLEDTTDGQLVLSLSDGLLRHALVDLNRDRAIVPEDLAHALYADIGRAVRKQRSKAKAIPVLAFGLAEDGTVKDERQATFLEAFLNLAEPRVAHVVPLQRRLGDSARAGREQAERKISGPTQLTAGPATALPASMHAR
jgi:hypothetical protein